MTPNWRSLAAVTLLCGAVACGRQAREQSSYIYPAATATACTAVSPAPSSSDDETTARGVKFSVRAPLNYNAGVRHPLLMMYAPAGYSRFSSERYYSMTREATAAGFVVAYADHLRLSLTAVEALGEVPVRVAGRWCIDPARVYFAGHSDGGSVSMGVTFLRKSTLAPAARAADLAPAAGAADFTPVAIVASGAGIRGSDLTNYQCPRPTRITLLHSTEDERFPGFGEEAIAWWAKCNNCAERASAPDSDGCYVYAGCAADTHFCPTRGEHARWPAAPAAVLKFLAASVPAAK